MTVTQSEGFENVPNGVAISTTNTTFDTINGTASDAVGDDSDPIHGAISCLLANDNFVVGQWDQWDGYARLYLRFDTAPGGNTSFLATRSGGSTKTEVRFHAGSGNIQIRNQNVAVDSSSKVFATGDVVRVEVFVDDVGNTQECRLFYDGNLEGTAPDETLSGAADNIPGTIDLVWFGISIAGGSGDLTMDDAALGDDWIGPAGAVLEAEWIYFDGVEEHPVEAFQWDGVEETPLETIVAE